MSKLHLIVTTFLLANQVAHAQEPKQEITWKETVEFARKIELDQAEGRESAFDDLFDLEGLVEECSAGLEMTAEEKSEFIKGARKASFGKSIGVAAGNSYHFLRTREVDGKWTLTFRLWSDGVNYHDLRIKRTPAGLRIADLLVYLSGEWLGQTLRRTLVIVAASKPARRAKLPAWAGEWLSHWGKVQEFGREAAQGAPEKALAIFESFPESIKKDRFIQSLRLRASAKVGDAAHVKAADDYARLFPEDGCRDIACMDGLILRKDFPKAFEAVDRIDKAVGGDPMLDVVRSRLYLMQGTLKPARESALLALKRIPSLADPHWLIIEITLKARNHAETVERLDAMEKALGVQVRVATLVADPAYADFVKSGRQRLMKLRPRSSGKLLIETSFLKIFLDRGKSALRALSW
jgi:hypothetical protein